MGTNYYHERDPLHQHVCTCCGKPLRCDYCESDYRTHIGKSSGGWTFSFHATDTIRSYAQWLAVLEAGGRIVNEYGEVVPLEEFKEMVEQKRTEPRNHTLYCQRSERGWERQYAGFLDPEGHSFSEGEFS